MSDRSRTVDATETVRRPVLRTLRTLLRNPIDAWPPGLDTAPLLRTRLLNRETVFVADPDLIGQLLVTDAAVYTKADTMLRPLRPALGDGLLTADGPAWRHQRRAAAPVFRHERLLASVPAMLAAARATRGRWLDRPSPGPAVDLRHEMMRTTFAIIVDTMLSGPGSLDPAEIERGVSEYLHTTPWPVALSVLGAPSWVPYPGQARAARAGARLRRAVLHLVAARRANPGAAPDLLDALLAAHDPDAPATGGAMSDAELADNLLTFIVAGHETTAIALTWTFHLLARHPEAEATALAEIAAVTQGDPLEPAHIPRLAYTRQAVEEAMRLYPPAGIVVREAAHDTRLGPHPIERGTSVYVPIYAVHRRPALWPDPERFEPGRFAPDQVRARHRHAYLPFGAGPRICIGAAFAMLEAVAIVATLLPAARLRPASGPDPRPDLRITLRPHPPIRMHVEPR